MMSSLRIAVLPRTSPITWVMSATSWAGRVLLMIAGTGASSISPNVGAADRLLVATVRLAVGERLQRDRPELDAETLGDLGREIRVRAAGEEHQPLLRPALDPVTARHLRGRRDHLEPRQLRQLSRRA